MQDRALLLVWEEGTLGWDSREALGALSLGCGAPGLKRSE